MTVNKKLMLDTLAQIEQVDAVDDPADAIGGYGWDQSVWRHISLDVDTERCGTAMCFAGWASTLDARTRNEKDDGWLIGKTEMLAGAGDDDRAGRWRDFCYDHENLLRACDDDDPADVYRLQDPDGNEHSVIPAELRAKRLLGLGSSQADTLFDGCNGIHALRRIVAELCGD